MGASARWARSDIRSRWRMLVALGLIAGITAGLSLAALAGARRTHSVLDRLRATTNAADAIVFSSQVGVDHPDWSALEARPEIRDLARWSLVFGVLDGDPEGLVFAPVDDGWLQRMDAPVVVEGRMFDPAADDEVVVAEGAAKAYGVHVGDVVRFTPYTVTDPEGQASDPVPGPDLDLRIVGIVRTPIEALFVGDGFAAASPGLLARHPDVANYENAMVRTSRGAADMSALEAHVNEDVAPGAPVLDLIGVSRRVTTTTDVERAALTLLAIAIAVAGLVLAGQVVVRSAAQVEQDARVLRAMGMRRSAIAWASVLAHLPAVATAVVAALAAATLASRWLPMGFAATLEPDPGIHLDATVVVPGLAVLCAALVGATFATAWLVASPSAVASVPASRGLGAWVRRHAGPAVGIGATLALQPGRGRQAVTVRPALLGAVVGVVGVAGAITMDAALRDTLAHPERAGVTWDAQVAPGQPDALTATGFSDDFVAAVGSVGGLADLVQVDRQPLPIEGTTAVPAFALRPLDGPTDIGLVTLSGRAPRAGEVVLGPATGDALGVGIGDVVEVGADPRPLEVVGTALFPSDVHAEFDEGLWVAPEDYDRLVPSGAERARFVAVRFDAGAAEAGIAALQEAAQPFSGSAGPADRPPELTNLREVLPLPKLLAAFLAVLAMAALLHVLASTTRARAGDFAVLRALGFTRSSTRLIVNVQATSVFLVGLLVGVPLGIAAGRLAWSEVSHRVPLRDVSPMAAVAVTSLVPITLLLAQLIAMAPGRRVARLRTAEVLRAE